MCAAERDSPSLRMTAGVKHSLYVQPFLQVISFKSFVVACNNLAFLAIIKHEDKLTDRLPRDDEHHKKVLYKYNIDLIPAHAMQNAKSWLHYINRLTDAL